ncbi:F-box protein CPR1-like [Silene latifolia]|uniref:F-box protein CPR1-like n=1 Tax=Silene latifolia TaxID=37657 RepID=UPI003D773B3E
MSELRGLPDEILVEILSKLPIKTLILCASTCKCLLSFITTPSFMVSQIQKVGHNHQFIFLNYYTHGINKHYFSLHPDDDSFNGDFCLIDMPVTCDCHVNNGCLLNVVGSCNGVICLSNAPCKCHYSNNIFLWNPSIRKSILLPMANNVSTDVWVGLGFGFDSLTNDFKVVRLVYYKCRDRMHLMLLVNRNGVVIKVLGVVDAQSSSLYMDTYVESLALFMEGRPMFDNKFQGYNPLLLK